jgi:hypothetical protein
MKIILDEKALLELNNFLQELPLKYGLPLVNFINDKIKEQQAQEAPSQPKEIKKK